MTPPFLLEDRAEVTMADFQLALCHIVPSTYRGLEGMVELRPVNWDDIGGLQDVKLALKQVKLFQMQDNTINCGL